VVVLSFDTITQRWSQLVNIKAIRNDADLQKALKRLETVFQAEACTPEADEMEMLVALIEAYEQEHYALSPNTEH